MKNLFLFFMALPAIAGEVTIELPAESASLALSSAASPTLRLQDPGNHPWLLQGSTDLEHWSDLGAYRVFNGHLDIPVSPGGPQRFFRTTSTPSLAGSTVARAFILPATPYDFINANLPAHLLTPQIRGQDNTPAGNAITQAGAALGRVLFYDRRLSANQTIACASCHQAEHGFSDSRRFSVGFAGGLTSRNSMGLTQARYYLRGHFFWDERAATLEDQVLQPIQNPLEMGMTLEATVSRLSAEPFYGELFTAAFGTPEVTSGRISRALAQFVRSIVSGHSKYDDGVAQNFANFTPQENLGRQIFGGQVGAATCVTCHGSDNFVPGNNIFNNGLENPYVDKGVGAISGRGADEGLFKVPSLRNIELTAPYMHDGRFATLEEVVEFYNSGVVNHPNLSPQLRNPPGPPGSPPPPPRRLNLTAGQKAALVAFLKTLTDRSVTTDPKFSDPFRYQAERMSE